MRLYRVERVLAVQGSPEFQDWLQEKKARKQKRKGAQARRFEQFHRKYGSWEAALTDGCEYAFSLNRYAKHGSCSDQNRKDIYDLKSGLVALLFQRGYCTECFEHLQHLPEQTCFGCAGTGIFDLYDLDPCRRCNGTGIFRKATTRTYVCFRFNVEGKTYCWHQPDHLVLFGYEVTTDSSAWKPSDEDEKPVTLAKSKFAEAKDLLRWILSQLSEQHSMAA